jgi:hypothetical protein
MLSTPSGRKKNYEQEESTDDVHLLVLWTVLHPCNQASTADAVIPVFMTANYIHMS